MAQDIYPQDYVPTVFDNYTANFTFGDGISFDMGLWDTMARSEEGERYCEKVLRKPFLH